MFAVTDEIEGADSVEEQVDHVGGGHTDGVVSIDTVDCGSGLATFDGTVYCRLACDFP